MMLLTKELERKLRKQHNENRDNSDNKPLVKFFCPWGAATWLVSELEPDGDTMFGLADLGMGCPELGYISLSELKSVKGPFGLGIERDRWFEPSMTLVEYWEKARAKGGLIA